MKTLHLQLEAYNGPFDVLLSLIDEQELSITDVALSQITEQYLQYLDQFDESPVEDLADFLVVASKLLLLKSKHLLPQLMPEEEEGPSLADQLRLYKLFVEASKQINALWDEKRQSFVRIEPMRIPEEFQPPENVVADILLQTMQRVVQRSKPPKPLPRTHIDKAVSLKERVQYIRNFFKKRKQLRFSETISDKNNKTEVIVSFLALLELVKQRTLSLHQEGKFADIVIKKV